MKTNPVSRPARPLTCDLLTSLARLRRPERATDQMRRLAAPSLTVEPLKFARSSTTPQS